MKIEQYLALSILSYSKSLSSFASSSGEPSIEALIKQGKIDNYRHSDGSIYLECNPSPLSYLDTSSTLRLAE